MTPSSTIEIKSPLLKSVTPAYLVGYSGIWATLFRLEADILQLEQTKPCWVGLVVMILNYFENQS